MSRQRFSPRVSVLDREIVANRSTVSCTNNSQKHLAGCLDAELTEYAQTTVSSSCDMTFSRILNAAAGAMGGAAPITEVPTMQTATTLNGAEASSGVDRLFPGYHHLHHHQPHHHHPHHYSHFYPQNPYEAAGSDLYDDVYFPAQFGLNRFNQGFHVKYGMADPTGYGGHQPHSYYGAPASGGGGSGYPHHSYQSHSYQPAPIVHPEPAPVSHPRSHKSSKSNASAMSALTLLAFLFFLNILQSCLKEHMQTMNPTVMVMTAGAGRRSAALKTTLEDRLTPDDADADVRTTPPVSTTAPKIEYVDFYSPDVDAKMFGADFTRSTKSNRTIQAKLVRNFDKVVRRT